MFFHQQTNKQTNKQTRQQHKQTKQQQIQTTWESEERGKSVAAHFLINKQTDKQIPGQSGA